MAVERHNHLDDASGREQAPEGVGRGAGESGSLADVDRKRGRVGPVADERGAVGGVRSQPLEVEQGLINKLTGALRPLERPVRRHR